MNPLLIHCIYCIRNCVNEFQIWCLFLKYNNVFKEKDHELFISEILEKLSSLELIVSNVKNS